jgi:hypothetical protein
VPNARLNVKPCTCNPALWREILSDVRNVITNVIQTVTPLPQPTPTVEPVEATVVFEEPKPVVKKKKNAKNIDSSKP